MSEKDKQEVSFLELSDEEMMNQMPPEPVKQDLEEKTEDDQDENQGSHDGLQKTAEEEVEEKDEDESGSEKKEDGADEEDEREDEAQGAGTATDAEDSQREEKQEEKKAESTQESQVDYKEQYEALLKPFKANGREMAVKSVDDARTLMQMGANYNKKMAALKPNLKLLKMLENNGLLDEAKLSYLIDLDKKNPDAINKLVKESGLDPVDLDTEKAGDYKPSKYAVDDREVELDAVLDEIQGTDTYNRTLEIVSRVWDGQSKQVIADTPQILKVINDHIQSGVYDLISQEVETERTYGRLQGLSDIEAYRQVGDRLNAEGKFDHLKGSSPQGHQTSPKQVVVPPKPKMGNEDKLREKKRAASSTKPTAASAPKADFNPLALSDAEFEKMVNTQFL